MSRHPVFKEKEESSAFHLARVLETTEIKYDPRKKILLQVKKVEMFIYGQNSLSYRGRIL